MNYRFETLKKLYNNFYLKPENNNTHSVISRNTHLPYNENEDIINAVKFAHSWVNANQNEELADEQAFNHLAKKNYNIIMGIAYNTLNNTGMLISLDSLLDKIQQTNKKKEVFDITTSLYTNQLHLESFYNWMNYLCKEKSKNKVKTRGE